MTFYLLFFCPTWNFNQNSRLLYFAVKNTGGWKKITGTSKKKKIKDLFKIPSFQLGQQKVIFEDYATLQQVFAERSSFGSSVKVQYLMCYCLQSHAQVRVYDCYPLVQPLWYEVGQSAIWEINISEHRSNQ